MSAPSPFGFATTCQTCGQRVPAVRIGQTVRTRSHQLPNSTVYCSGKSDRMDLRTALHIVNRQQTTACPVEISQISAAKRRGADAARADRNVNPFDAKTHELEHAAFIVGFEMEARAV